MGFKEVSEKQWLATTRARLAEKLKVEPGDLRFSPSKRLVACVREIPPPTRKKPPKRPPPRRYQIHVVDPEGARKALFAPVTLRGSDEPPRDFRFLAEDRLIYEVVPPPPPPPPAVKVKKRPPRKKAPPPPKPTAAAWPTPTRLFIIQPVERRQRRLRCEGVHFTFSNQRDHLAFVSGKPEASSVSVDGVQVYPRRGRTAIVTEPSWSKDGRSLAFLENTRAGKPRLVLLAQFDNPTGDTTWDLPAAATATEGAHVFWAGSGKLVVGKSPTKPLFSTSFTREPPPGASEKYKNAGP
jgi:hypothetical protein